jgi:hypothetical protein
MEWEMAAQNNTRPDGKSLRMRERLEISLPVKVLCRESVSVEWTEITRLIDVTPFGAGFTLTHPMESGRLLNLTLAMPRQLRCYDHAEQQYRVWSLVRHVKPLLATADAPQRYIVGVAFLGKRPPSSYEKDPTTRYEAAASPTETGLWTVTERDTGAESRSHLEEEFRPATRHNIPVEVMVEVFDDNGNVVANERTVTENINQGGAAVMTTLDVERGRFVRITSEQYQITVMAAVRARRVGPDGIPRLHLEFIDRQWPLGSVD